MKDSSDLYRIVFINRPGIDKAYRGWIRVRGYYQCSRAVERLQSAYENSAVWAEDDQGEKLFALIGPDGQPQSLVESLYGNEEQP
jgi:hypothetical protein